MEHNNAAPAKLDAIDKKLLDIIQSGFPLEKHPYEALGQQLGIPGEEAFSRVEAMRKNGVIRRLGANFQSRKLGFVSTLCAAKVPPKKLESFISVVNADPGVTHNYERDHDYNIWFTLISPSRESEADSLRAISKATGVEILNLPATRLFKIRVDFPMADEE